jgi:hypothetical protein
MNSGTPPAPSDVGRRASAILAAIKGHPFRVGLPVGAPDFAPPGIDLDTVLTARFGPAVTRTVRELEREHSALNDRAEPTITGVTDWTVHASTADKIVSLSSIVRRASRAPDRAAYWHRRPAFVARVPYFIAFAELASPRLPPGMAAELQHIVARAVAETGQRENAGSGLHTPIP